MNIMLDLLKNNNIIKMKKHTNTPTKVLMYLQN